MRVDLIFDVAIIIIGFYLAFFKSYFQEKGKNMATTEDIGKLTLKVESVKQEFIEKNAHLKSKLDLITNLQLNHKNDEREALIDFHKKLNTWIGLLTEASPSLINEYDSREIQEKVNSYDKAYQEVLSAEALLDLYVEDEKLIMLIHDVKINTVFNLVKPPLKYLGDLKHNNFEFEHQKKMKVDTSEDIDKRAEKHAELIKKRKEIIQEHVKNMLNGQIENTSFEKEYRAYIRKYISKISSE